MNHLLDILHIPSLGEQTPEGLQSFLNLTALLEKEVLQVQRNPMGPQLTLWVLPTHAAEIKLALRYWMTHLPLDRRHRCLCDRLSPHEIRTLTMIMRAEDYGYVGCYPATLDPVIGDLGWVGLLFNYQQWNAVVHRPKVTP